MDIMEMVRRNMMGNHSGSAEGETNVSSIFDLIFPRSSTRPGTLGLDDTQGLFPSSQEIPGGLLSFWQTRLSKWQAIMHKMFDDIKQKANEQWQELTQKHAMPMQPDIPLNARSAQMGSSAGGETGYVDPFNAGSSGVSTSYNRSSGSGYSR